MSKNNFMVSGPKLIHLFV